MSPLQRFQGITTVISTRSLDRQLSIIGVPRRLDRLTRNVGFVLRHLSNKIRRLSRFSSSLTRRLQSPVAGLVKGTRMALSQRHPTGRCGTILRSYARRLKQIAEVISSVLFLTRIDRPTTLIPFRDVLLRSRTLGIVSLFSLSTRRGDINVAIDK